MKPSQWGQIRPSFLAVAGLLELTPVVLLTDAGRPYQPYVGRGEALLALEEVVAGRAEGWLADHTRSSARESCRVEALRGGCANCVLARRHEFRPERRVPGDLPAASLPLVRKLIGRRRSVRSGRAADRRFVAAAKLRDCGGANIRSA